MKKYKLNEIFYSLQGEGYNTGKAAIFIRFSKCNLKCSFCDTDFSQKMKLTAKEILNEIKPYKSKLIVLTGGEPTLQIDNDLLKTFKDNGYTIAIESNGTNEISPLIDWVTISPKTLLNQRVGDEIKVIWTLFDKFDYTKTKFKHKYIQAESEKNIPEIINFIKNNPKWKLSIQIQKILKIQ